MVLKRTAQLSVLITPEERKILDTYCSLVDLPMARVISKLIREHLKPEERKMTRKYDCDCGSFAEIDVNEYGHPYTGGYSCESCGKDFIVVLRSEDVDETQERNPDTIVIGAN